MPRLGDDLEVARATARRFTAVGQIFVTYPSRHTGTRPLASPYLHVAVITGLAVQVGAASLPLTVKLLGNAQLPLELWAFRIAGAMLAWALAEVIARVVWRSHAAGTPR
jgi:Ca2+-transporting ATPase